MQNDHIAGTKGNSNKKITQNKFSTLSDAVIFAIPSGPGSLIEYTILQKSKKLSQEYNCPFYL